MLMILILLHIHVAAAFLTPQSFVDKSPATARRSTLTQYAKKDSLNAIDDPFEILGRDTFQKYFEFPIDSWQAKAGGEIVEGRNVIACAPTGAGKTVVGEMALHLAFHSGRNAIYTTPLKALSNQKFAELRSSFGSKNVGLATGDMSINRGAQIMVMTTEVYRNMAWRAIDEEIEESEDEMLDDVISSKGRSELSNLACVVLDEFHYMGQKGRGGVWEECVITSPSHTQIVALSATLPNAANLAQWMQKVSDRHSTLIMNDSGRPVPLRFMYANRDGIEFIFSNRDAGPGAPLGLLGYRGDGVPESQQKKKKKTKSDEVGITKHLEEFGIPQYPKGLQMNHKLKSAMRKRSERINRLVAKRSLEGDDRRKFQRNRRDDSVERRISPREERKQRERILKQEMRKEVPSLHFLVRRLNQIDLLPAIFFLFSRVGCDEAAGSICHQMKKQAAFKASKEQRSPIDSNDKKGRKSRQRSAKKEDSLLMKDGKGRTFRSESNFITEETMTSIIDGADIYVDEEITNPLEDENLHSYADRGLLTYSQVKEVASRIKLFNEANEEIKFSDENIDRFLHGVGSHHAGHLPAHKAFVESLFRKQLMRIVFATETLAAGINMPARTTVITNMAKRGEGGTMNLLETANMLQMAGRAGRRGMDTDGTCVLVATPFEGVEEGIDILISEIKPVESQFSPGYALAVNLIARGKGKLDVAQTLVQKSFAIWEKQQAQEKLETVKEIHGDAFDEIIEQVAHEQFLDCLNDLIGKDRNKKVFDILEDKQLLKKASKSFTGLNQILNLEESTLGYLEKELQAINQIDDDLDKDGMLDLLSEDNVNIETEILNQKRRIRKANEDVSNHIMTYMAVEANTLLKSSITGVDDLKAALRLSRKNSVDIEADSNVTPTELTYFVKSAVTMNRKRRKQKNAAKSNDMGNSALIDQLANAEEEDDSLEDLCALINVLQAYGCIVPTDESSDKSSPSYRITTAGENVGLLGLDNSLWALVAMGGAWDVLEASADLDKFKAELNSLGTHDNSGLFDDFDDDPLFDDIDEFDNGSGKEHSAESQEVESDLTVPLPQAEAATLVDQLRALEPDEIAGYVSCLVADSPRGGGASVLSSFQQLSHEQQKVIQSSLLSLERLSEVQNKYSVDETARKVQVELGTCEVVTAWTAGCSWNEALEISGSAPGDLVRILHRVLDSLRQIGNLPVNAVRSINANAGIIQMESTGIHPDVRQLCREAATAMDRYPVKDPLPFEDDEDTDDDHESDEDVDHESDEDANHESDEDADQVPLIKDNDEEVEG
uniref:RNA helicase n=1 Tax=Chaetoceros debilis TaxID=122233 RepID=A0A7S3PXN5_9STRA|mmetsp:Transcript_2466/g.3676  ORF Transcript_2466/g.3676 Transcript_2466/m.3676 type:complete len:1291 (-) Transcript_2466:268-4140(-)